MALIYLSSAWVVGIYLGSVIALPPGMMAFGLMPLCLIPFLARYWKLLVLVSVCLLAFLGGGLRFQSTLPVIDEHHLQPYNDKGMIQVEGMICNDPATRGTASVFQVSAREIIMIDGRKEQISGKALVRVPAYPGYVYGDVVRLTGKLETPRQFDDFDYRGYLARQGVYSVMYYPKAEILDRGRGFKPLGWIYWLRGRLAMSISLALPEPQASLAKEIFLGLRGDLPYSLQKAFSQTGTTHLLAISGLNLTIIIGMLLSIGIWLFGRRYSIYIWLALSIIWIYALATGMHPPVVRAAIMGTVFLAAEFLGRQRSATTALAFAAAVMVAIEPQILWDASFQLSFLAMAGLIFMAPQFQGWARGRFVGRDSSRGAASSFLIVVVDSFVVTLAAVLFTCPVIAYYFGTISLVSLPATLFALPALPGIIVIVALVGIAGLFLPFLAQVLGWVAWLFLSYLILIVEAFGALPFSFADIGGFHVWQIWCYYVLLAIALIAINYRRRIAILFSWVRAKWAG